MNLDDMIKKYMNGYETLQKHLVTIENGNIPMENVEGAPDSLGEARQAVMGMSFMVEQFLGDLLDYKMTIDFEDSELTSAE